MAQSQIIRIACLISCIALTGCGSLFRNQSVTTRSAADIAIDSLSPELLVECAGMPPAPGNSVGALLEDSKEAMLLLAECQSRQRNLVRYIRAIPRPQDKK